MVTSDPSPLPGFAQCVPCVYERNTVKGPGWNAVMCTKERFVLLCKMTVGFWSKHVVESLQLAKLANDFEASDKSGRLELGDLTNLSPKLEATDASKWQVRHEIGKWRFLEWSPRPEARFYGQLAFAPPFENKVAVLDYDENDFAKSITDARDGGATAIIIINKKKFDGVKEKFPDAVAEVPPDKLPWCSGGFRRDRPAADKQPDKQRQSRCTPRLGQFTQVVDDVFVLMVSYNEGQVAKERGAGTWLMLEGESSRRETQMHS